MKRTTLEQKLRQKLAAEGVNLEPGSRAERGVKKIATVGAELATASEQAVKETRDMFNRAADAAREAIHNATKQTKRRKK